MGENELKCTGLPWLPQIPSRWALMRNKDFLEEVKDVAGENSSDFTLLSLTTQGIIPRDMDSGKGKFPSDFSKYKVVRKGNLAFCLFDIDETPRTVGLSPMDGMLTGAYSIFHVAEINPRYLYHYYLTLDNIKALKSLYSGLRKTISSDLFSSMKFPVPDNEEQNSIVEYLDWQESAVNKVVTTKHKEISLLKEAEHIYIKELVLGINKGYEMKSTHLPWASEVPTHWERYRHKHLLVTVSDKVGADFSEHTLLSLTTLGVIPRDVESGKGKFPSDFSTYQVVKKGQFVFCLFDVDETPRTVGMSKEDGMITGAYTVFDVKIADPEYLLYYFMMIDDEKAFKPLYSGLRKVIRIDAFLSQSIYLPSLEEQKTIVKKIEAFIMESRKVKMAYQEEIVLLKEARINIALKTISGNIDTRTIKIPEYKYVEDSDETTIDNETYMDEEE